MSDRGIERDHGGGVVAGWVLVESLVRPVVVEMALVVVKDGTSVSFVIDQQPVGALGADAADEPLGIAICLWCPGRDLDYFDAVGGEDGIKGVGEFGVSVADQEAERGDVFAEAHQ